jgi:Spy/CpxP family protein refolding chaperone
MMRRLHLVLAALLLAPLPLAAQRAAPQNPPPARAEAHERGPIQSLLQHREALRLSADQVARLAQIDAQMHERNRPLVEQMVRMRREIRGDAPTNSLTPEQRAEMRQRLEVARPLMEQIRQNNHEAMRQVGDVLNEEQKRQVRTMLESRRERHDGGGHPRDGKSRDGSSRPSVQR